MDVTVIINRLLAEFATKYGLPSLALNQEGVAALCFDEQLQLSLILVPERDQLVLQADVAELQTPLDGWAEGKAAECWEPDYTRYVPVAPRDRQPTEGPCPTT